MKRIIAIILSFIILGVALAGADFVLKDRTVHGVKQAIALYEQPEDSIDVLVLGSSHVHCGVNTAKMWADYGIAAFDMSTAEQALWISYYYLKEACKTQHPKVVVLDAFSPAAYPWDYKNKYRFMSDSVNGFKLNWNKLAMMTVSFDFKKSVWDKYFPGFFGYHDRYDQLTDEDFDEMSYDYTNFKGYTPRFGAYETQYPRIGSDETLKPSDKSIAYLQKIIDYTRENDIQLFITIVPYTLNNEVVTGVVQEEDKRYNWIAQYVAEQNEAGNDHVFFDYTFTYIDDFGIDFEGGEDIHDPSHLNYYGGCKFTTYLSAYLLHKYGSDVIPDHRGDPAYSSWDRHVEEIKAYIEENGCEWR
jgi:hypothetical protein